MEMVFKVGYCYYLYILLTKKNFLNILCGWYFFFLQEIIIINDKQYVQVWSYIDHELKMMKETSILTSLLKVGMGKNVAGMATGYLLEATNGAIVPQHLVLVTKTWHVLCFDHELNLKWEHLMDEDIPERYYLG
jgi:hypothetical protein